MSFLTTLASDPPITVTLINIGLVGPPGPPGGGAAIEHAFAFGDATPAAVVTAAANKLIYGVTVHIIEPFDGVGAALTVGDAAQPDRLLAANQNDPTSVAAYAATPEHTYLSATPILLSITPGAGATQGKGLLTIELQV